MDVLVGKFTWFTDCEPAHEVFHLVQTLNVARGRYKNCSGRQLCLFASFLSCCNGMEGEQAFVPQMCILASTSTNAANPTEKAIGLMAQSVGASRSNAQGEGGVHTSSNQEFEE